MGKSLIYMARATGLEPATSGVTGRHSNQLSYTRALLRISKAGRTYWWGRALSRSICRILPQVTRNCEAL